GPIFKSAAGRTEPFGESRDVPFDCLADPLREAYGEVSLRRGKRKNLYTWGVAKAVVRNAAAGNFGGRPKAADQRQMPGTFVIGTDGRVRLAHYNASTEDNPSVERVLDAVR